MAAPKTLVSNLLLFITAGIWGFAFVAQKAGGDFLGPFTFNGVRFLLGALSLVPLVGLFYFSQKKSQPQGAKIPWKAALIGGSLMGIMLFVGASAQQIAISPAIGVTGTTAGKAAFITGLYIIIVPLFGVFLKHRLGPGTWPGAVLALVGLYLLCIQSDFTFSPWDLLVLAGTPFWALHILLIDYYSKKVPPLYLALIQTVVCAVVSLALAFILEPISWQGLLQASGAIAYAGIGSVGIAYTLQVVGQKHAKPASAAIILSLEVVFAALGGWWLLGQGMDPRQIWGAALMLGGLVVSQVFPAKNPEFSTENPGGVPKP